jgi:hypothetical protein
MCEPTQLTHLRLATSKGPQTSISPLMALHRVGADAVLPSDFQHVNTGPQLALDTLFKVFS